MSRANKRKHLAREVFDDFSLPTKSQQIVRVTENRGNYLHEVETATGERFLISMPVKFRKCVWVMIRQRVLIDCIAEGEKVKGELVRILTKEHIDYFKANNCWPKFYDDTEDDLTEQKDNKSRVAVCNYIDSNSESDKNSVLSETDDESDDHSGGSYKDGDQDDHSENERQGEANEDDVRSKFAVSTPCTV